MLKAVLWLLLAAIICSLQSITIAVNAQDSQDKIPWSENRSLQWSDFQGVTGIFPDDYEGRRTGIDAYTQWWLDATWEWQTVDSDSCEYVYTQVGAVAFLFMDKSWVREGYDSDEELLKHEQGHLDIVEIHARKFENELLNRKFMCPDGIFNADQINQKTNEIFNEIFQQTREMHLRYDEETNLSEIKEKQNEWNVKIECLLEDNRDEQACLSVQNEEIQTLESESKTKIPEWIKNNAMWWSEGQIGDSDFTGGIQFMIKENIMVIPDLPESAKAGEEQVPDWVRNNAGWWADGLISDDDFVSGIKYLVEQGIIRV